jgi:hypothetical protein
MVEGAHLRGFENADSTAIRLFRTPRPAGASTSGERFDRTDVGHSRLSAFACGPIVAAIVDASVRVPASTPISGGHPASAPMPRQAAFISATMPALSAMVVD